ncbi:MAG: hypothetical protein ABI559_13385 [Chloroflexota bacterium]
MAEQKRAELLVAQSDVAEDDGCAHHWMIDTPNGESSEGHCKRCGKARAFLNYSQRKVMTRSVKPAAPGAPGSATKMSV